MDNQQQLLQLSTKLYEFLEKVPNGEQRDVFFIEMNRLLDERGRVIEAVLHDDDIKFDSQNNIHQMIIKLDKGIRERLDHVMEAVKTDLKHLQTAKNKEKHYINPYASVQVMDGRYYDKKK